MNEKNEFFIKTLLNQKHIFNENFKYNKKIFHKSKICGDFIDFFLNIENNTIKEIKYKSSSCSINLVGAEIISEYINNNKIKLQELNNIDFENIIKSKIEISKEKNHCLNLNLEILKKINEIN